jgi:lambda family phage portal protein
VQQTLPTILVSDLPEQRIRYSYDDGSKFAGGFGPTELLTADYWTLRARSIELFERNLYARGLIRRLVINEINTGLHLEAVPEEKILGLEEDALSDWSEEVENRFRLWADEPNLCDHQELATFGALQFAGRLEALIAGDVLCVLQQDRRTGLPRLRLIPGGRVQTPLEKVFPKAGENLVKHGVEVDENGRHVAFWVQQDLRAGESLPTFKRLPAYGEKSGRKIAWLVYGTDKRHEQVRGKPMLSLILQALKEIDRYRDAVQRKAVVNSILAMFIKKGEAKPGTRPLGNSAGGAVRKTVETTTDGKGNERTFRVAEQIPGLVLDELQHGEEPMAFMSSIANEKFAEFEAAMLQAIAWANNVPPEILTLAFQNNYSASQAAINEFKMYLNLVRTDFGNTFCRPIYVEWLVASVLAGKLKAPGFLDSFRDFTLHDVFTAWVSSDWSGHIKPAVDLSKLVGGYEKMIAMGSITRARAARELTGTRFSKNVQQLRKENAQIAEANKPIAELEKPPAAPPLRSVDDDDEEEKKTG